MEPMFTLVKKEEHPSIGRAMLRALKGGQKWIKHHVRIGGFYSERPDECHDPALCILGALGMALYGDRVMREIGDNTDTIIRKIRADPQASQVAQMLCAAVDKRSADGTYLVGDLPSWNDHASRQWRDIEAVLVTLAEMEYAAYCKAAEKA